ncbi:MAG: hypothetical protein V7L23_15200 [Nostoc sp.]|uniref:hypothetical protein n=1 Tax=Nostoc sp. TaxID=1180 RepID=UPI002FF2439C
MPNLTKTEKKRGIAVPSGCIAIGQAKRGGVLELVIKRPSLKRNDEASENASDSDPDDASPMQVEFVFSSEYPVLRYDWWEDESFYEVLDHKPSSVNSSRIQEGVCPLLWNHNRNDQRGLISSISFANGKASCIAQYDDDADGQSLYKKVMGGTRRAVSFMYQVNGEYEQLDMQSSSALLAKYGISDPSLYAPVRVAKNWEIFEVSHVSIPADPTVGVGKSMTVEESESNPVIVRVKNYTKFPTQKDMKTKLEESKENAQTEAIEIQEPSTEVRSEGVVGATGSVGTTGIAVEPAVVTVPTTINLTADQIRSFIAESVSPIQERAEVLEKQNLEVLSDNERLRKELEERDAKLALAAQKAEVFSDISKLIGRPESPMLNVLTNPVNNNPHGAAKEFIELFNDPRVKPTEVTHRSSSNVVSAVQRDPRILQRYINSQFAEERAKGVRWQDSHFVRDLETYFKAQGFLSGRAAGPTLGTTASIGAIYLDVLSTMMRETHNQNNIWWQFPTTVYDSTSAPNKSILIPRANYLPAPQAVSDFLIADYADYNAINYVRGTSTDSQGLEITVVPVTIAQWGLGLSTNVGNRPVFIPEFTEQTSLVNLMTILDQNLMQHYFAFEDLFIRSQFYQATTVYYNAGDTVVTNPLSVTAGKSGACTEKFLNAVYSQLYAAKWPTMSNNHYCLLLPPNSLNQLKNDLNNLYRVPTEAEREAISNVLLAATGIQIGETSGYQGSYAGFDIFSGNSWGVGAAGIDATVNSTTFGTGAAVTEDAFVFAPGAVGRGIALPVEIRASGTTPFQMGESYIWLSREQVAPVDLDSSLNASQQTRCAKLRFARVAQ